MKTSLYLILLTLTHCWPTRSLAQDRTRSPHFYISGNDPDVEAFPLLHTEAKVHIAGVIADVQVSQVYCNSGKKPIEAVYVFPASTRAAVYDMQMRIGDRLIRAEVREKQLARQDYEDARRQGKSASLLEQHRPNVFQMSVANIMPGDTIRIEANLGQANFFAFGIGTSVNRHLAYVGQGEPFVVTGAEEAPAF
jgi:Ca-activated chloride channel homolog